MKNLVVLFAVLTFAFFFACQESNVTDPVQDDAIDLTQQDSRAEKDLKIFNDYKVIKIEGFVADPLHNQYTKQRAAIKGTIAFEHQLLPADPVPPLTQKYVSLKMWTDIKITVNCPNGEKIWKVYQYTDDMLAINSNSDSFTFFAKAFAVENACCHPVDMMLKFRVSESTLELESVKLYESNADFIEDTY
jgi:hypothetical protein